MSDVVQPQPSGPLLFWLVYGQVAAMLGAFSLLVFLHNFVDFGLKELVAQTLDGWVYYVRPIVGDPLELVVAVLPDGWRFEVSPLMKDYVGVGAVTGLSILRASASLPDFRPQWMVVIMAAILMLFLWPLIIALFWGIWDTAKGDDGVGRRMARLFMAMTLAPLVYLGLLLAANYVLPA